MDMFALLGENYRLVLAGDGILRASLEAEARRRFPGRASFLGHIQSRAELAKVFAGADVFVQTNPAEPFGIAPLEAMANGVPLVGPNSGGILTCATERNAWLVPPVANKFAAAVEACFDEEERARRVSEGFATAKRFHAPETAGRFLEMYREFVMNGAAPEPDYVSTPGTWLGSEV